MGELYKEDLFYDDDFCVVDVSVYGSACGIPASSWPSEEAASTEDVLANLALLNEFHAERKGFGHVPRPPNFTASNKLLPEDSFPNCPRQFSPYRVRILLYSPK